MANNLPQYNATLPVLSDGQMVTPQVSNRGVQLVNLTGVGTSPVDGWGNANSFVFPLSVAGTPLMGVTGNYIFNGTSWDRLTKSNQVARLVSSAATTNATNVKASPGNVRSINGANINGASTLYLKLYNKASAPVVGTDTPVMTLRLAPNTNFSFAFDGGHYFSTGISYALTTNPGDADATAVAANDISCMNILYS